MNKALITIDICQDCIHYGCGSFGDGVHFCMKAKDPEGNYWNITTKGIPKWCPFLIKGAGKSG